MVENYRNERLAKRISEEVQNTPIRILNAAKLIAPCRLTKRYSGLDGDKFFSTIEKKTVKSYKEAWCFLNNMSEKQYEHILSCEEGELRDRYLCMSYSH